MTPFLLLLSCFLLCAATATSNIPKHHVVYMGSSLSDGNRREAESAESAYLEMLSSIIPSHQRERTSIIHKYNHAFRGFSAMLTESEASALSGHADVVSIFPDSILELHTTRSWDFIQEAGAEPGGVSYHPRPTTTSDDVIIGVIDTGIWPESPSFNDEGIGAVPSRWKGVCMEGPDFKKSNCNRKLIGARYYNVEMTRIGNQSHLAAPNGSPRDSVGHGTHTTSTAAGARVPDASYYGLAQGTSKGGLPSARIACYKACSDVGCSGATILKAIDDAIRDGVDMISISIGLSSLFQPDYLNDPIAIGAFHAEQMGVMVICSGGNDGPDPYTVVNTAPWIFTVAASNIDRDFQSSVVLGNGRTFTGSAINFSNLTRSRTYPLVFGKDAAANFTPVSEASNCYPGSFDPKKVAGKIVVCVADDQTVSRKIKKLVVDDAKAKGLILIDEEEKTVPFDSGVFPFVNVGDAVGSQILNYINSTKNPRATILPTVDVHRYRPAPTVAYFSSRGPAQLTENILKPDIMAPGVAILAAICPKNEPGSVPDGEKPSKFSIKSGTSMACPHVTGAAAFIKSVHRGWTSSMIKSALMTTATMYNNMKKPLINSTNNYANPHEVGVGEINPIKALNPGLVFETITENYLEFLCYYGYKEKDIRLMSNTKFNCPKVSTEKLISNINYPSISVSKLNRHQPVMTIKRTATNVGAPNSTYIAKVNAPVGLVVKVLPEKIVFAEGVRKVSFQVSFYGKEAPTGYSFGSITWFDGRHSVNTVFSVNVE
ncbi:PREDICTED: CO(2)-response secreted protease-like [Fragaria vesca subsp. vesca]|uniref:CO(2)-response secreted protease-like n=1 Tax=Fragaria vesca subsp. vesca TaxID=101020 RepID=UPI0002C307C8|nr:PREDICTED: CO(2)-response secreted protease-like [Fragaria vesca subsp. vesca]